MTAQRRSTLVQPERLYWAVLPSPAARRGRTTQLLFALEALLPVPLESVHVVFVNLADGRTIACAADQSFLRDQLARGVITLRPARLPAFLDGITPHVCNQMNLLTGGFEAAPVVAQRRRLSNTVACGLVVLAMLSIVGLERRAGSERQRAQAARTATTEMLAQILPHSASTQPAELRLAAELRQLQRTRTQQPKSDLHTIPDAAWTLAEVLSNWPESVELRTESLSITSTAVTLVAAAPDHARAQQLVDALASLSAWRVRQPEVAAVRDGVRVTIRLAPHGAGSSP